MSKLRIITVEKLIEMRENNEPFTLVEVLGEESYRDKHLPGAINVPTPKEMTVAEMEAAAATQNIAKEDTVMVYCASYSCQASTRAARLLLEAGFSNVLDYKAGKAEWQAVDLEFESA